MFFTLFSQNTWYIFNVFVQSIGYYLQWILQLGFHTDAFAQMANAPDGKENPDWIDGWTIFYCKLFGIDNTFFPRDYLFHFNLVLLITNGNKYMIGKLSQIIYPLLSSFV